MTILKFFGILFLGCSSQPNQQFADVVSVEASGSDTAYTFSVGVSSPDTGCEQYADWWEVITDDGSLIYRRILAHSHADEQPFVRSGGPVKIGSSQIVIVRAHMNKSGYGGQAFKGSVENGFEQVPLEKDFAIELEKQSPLPGKCAF